jgi:DNA-binding response OmpR family regulator
VTARGRVLYIDDDPGLARLVQKTLQAQGFEVEFALSGSAGLRLLEASRFDVIGLDHHMPEQSGLEILPKIRSLSNAPPVIYVTGSEDSRVAVAALKAGAVDYVWKDVQGHFRELLTEAIITALEKEQLRRDKEAADREVLAALDRAELLLREVNHRVANSLSIVAALTHMQRSAVKDESAKRVIDEMHARILAVAGVHKRLYTSHDVQSVDVQAYLGGLIEELKSAMLAWGGNHNIQLQAHPVSQPTKPCR